MNKPYLFWAFLGMVGYSFTALLVKLATASGRFSGFFVLMISASMVVISSATISFLRGEMKAFHNLATVDGAFLLGTGVALAIAVVSYFHALSIGPASIVVPVFGMFIVGGAVLGLLFLHEPLTLRKAMGILLAIASIYLIAGHPKA
jgi:bacterial/archaeal transporter family protein